MPPNRSVLVVDDDHAIRAMLAEALEDAGFLAQTAENGAQALALLRAAAELPDVILLDLMMPVMTGWEFRAAQREDARLAPIPVVVLSARPSIQHDSYPMSASAFLPKPMDIGRLLDLVEDLCARRPGGAV